jgi:hypothetical protein
MSESVTQAPALPSVIVKVLGGLRRSGRFALQARTRFVTLIGGVDLDLTEAVLPASGARLTKVSVIGGVHIRIGPDIGVKVRAFRLLGGTNVERAEDVPPTAAVLDVRAWSLIGGVRVSR